MACSMQSFLIFPAILCFGAAVMHSLFNNTLNVKKPVENKQPSSKTIKFR
ncbi:MAG: hypothetical protein MJ248_03745 [Bacilli bacterium]|nr:hypothetical protein [Bacilli bacterium]